MAWSTRGRWVRLGQRGASRAVAAALGWLPFAACLPVAGVDRAWGQAAVCGTVADEFIAAEVGLEREWIVQVPFDSAGWRLRHVVVGRDLVIAQSGDGGISAIQVEAAAGQPRPGSVLWTTRIGTPGGPAAAAGIGPELITVARDLDIYALHRSSGHLAWRERLGRTVGAGATTVEDFVYAPLGSEVLRLPVERGQAAQDPMPEADAAASASTAGSDTSRDATEPGATEAQRQASREPLAITSGGPIPFPVRGDGNDIFWITDTGRIVVLDRAADGWTRLEYELGAAPVAIPPVRDGSLYAALAGNGKARPTLTRVDLLPSGRRRLRAGWWTPLPDDPDQGPFVSGDTVVVSLGPSGLAAYSAETGEPLWRSCVVGTIVTVSGERVWVFDELGRLSGVELASGIAREWLSVGCLTMPVINHATDRLVLASPTGLLVSLAPVNRLPAPADPAAAPAPPADATAPTDPAPAPTAEDPDPTLL
jgi:outer membrane protein assembly factor BamB